MSSPSASGRCANVSRDGGFRLETLHPAVLHLQRALRSPVGRAGRERVRREAVGPGGRIEDRHVEERGPSRVVREVVVQPAVAAREPLPVGDVDRARGPAVDDVAQHVGLALGFRDDVFLHQEQQAAPHDRQRQERQRRAIQADAARPHHRELARARESANRRQHRDQRGRRDDVRHELRRRVEQELREDADGRLAFRDFVGEVDDRADVIEPQERQEGEPGHAQVLGPDVQIEQPRARRQRQPRNANDHDDTRPALGSGALRAREPLPEAIEGRRDRERRAARTLSPPQKHEPEHAQDDVREPAGPGGREVVALGEGLGQLEQAVVDEDHDQPERQSRELAFLPRVQPQGEANQRKHQARDRERELLVEVHDRAARGAAVGPVGGDHLLEVGDVHLRKAPVEIARAEDRVGRNLDAQRFGGLRDVIDRRVGAGHVAPRLVEPHVDFVLVWVEAELARLGQRDRGPARLRRIRQEDA